MHFFKIVCQIPMSAFTSEGPNYRLVPIRTNNNRDNSTDEKRIISARPVKTILYYIIYYIIYYKTNTLHYIIFYKLLIRLCVLNAIISYGLTGNTNDVIFL